MANATHETTRVLQTEGAQAVRIPEEFHLNAEQVYIRRAPNTGVLEISEKPFKPSLEEVFAMFDALDLSDFEIERDHSVPRDIDL